MTVKTIFVLTTYYIVPRITLKFIFTGTYGKGTKLTTYYIVQRITLEFIFTGTYGKGAKLTTYYIVPRITLEFIIYWDLWEGNKINNILHCTKDNTGIHHLLGLMGREQNHLFYFSLQTKHISFKSQLPSFVYFLLYIIVYIIFVFDYIYNKQHQI